MKLNKSFLTKLGRTPHKVLKCWPKATCTQKISVWGHLLNSPFLSRGPRIDLGTYQVYVQTLLIDCSLYRQNQQTIEVNTTRQKSNSPRIQYKSDHITKKPQKNLFLRKQNKPSAEESQWNINQSTVQSKTYLPSTARLTFWTLKQRFLGPPMCTLLLSLKSWSNSEGLS